MHCPVMHRPAMYRTEPVAAFARQILHPQPPCRRAAVPPCRRAAAAVDYLAANFKIDRSRLEPVGMGDLGLLVPTPDQTSEPRNRRVAVVNIGSSRGPCQTRPASDLPAPRLPAPRLPAPVSRHPLRRHPAGGQLWRRRAPVGVPGARQRPCEIANTTGRAISPA
jgi:hypothetical protein